jgi:hypothetical protein
MIESLLEGDDSAGPRYHSNLRSKCWSSAHPAREQPTTQPSAPPVAESEMPELLVDVDKMVRDLRETE